MSKDEALTVAWDHLRSVYEVSRRKGESTNWDALEKRTIETISEVVVSLGFEPKMPNMAITAKTFRKTVDA